MKRHFLLLLLVTSSFAQNPVANTPTESPTEVPAIPFVRSPHINERPARPFDAQIRALRWLKSLQREDGSWPGPAAATTAMVLLAYNSSVSSFPDESDASCANAIRFLVSDVDEAGAFRSGDPGEWTLPVGLVALECWVLPRRDRESTEDESGGTAIARAKRRLLDRQRESGLWGPEGGPDDFWYTWLTLRALAGSPVFPEDTATAVERAYAALARAYDAKAGVLRAPDGSPDPATRMLFHVLELTGENVFDAMRTLAKSYGPVRFCWEDWDNANLSLASSSPLRDAVAMHLSSFPIGWARLKDWQHSFMTNRGLHQTVLDANESDYVDSQGRKCSLGWWDSPSPDEFRFCDGGPELPCVRWKNGYRIETTTTLGARIQDTCRMIIPDVVFPITYRTPQFRSIADIDYPPVFVSSENNDSPLDVPIL